MMKKCSVITGMILASLLLFMNSCEKDYLNAEEISYSLTVSDTVYLNEPVTIKGFPGIFPGEGTIGLIPYLYVNPIQVCLLLIEQAIREGICADDVVKLSVILNVIFF